jgi:hypothetical protein
LIRDGDELERAVRYVVRNPERAGLKGWRWVWCAGEEGSWRAGEDARRTADLEIGATNSGTGATKKETGTTRETEATHLI